MAVKFTTSSDSFDRGGTYLDAPGTYHLSVMDANDQPSSKEGKMIDGWNIKLAVLAGTVAGQEKKEINITLWNPSQDDDEKQRARSHRKQSRFLEAVCLVDRHKPGTGEIDLTQSHGRQLIATLARKQKKDPMTGKYVDDDKGLQLNYDDIFHIDDPDAAGFPQHKKAIGLLPAELRRDKSYFGDSNGNGNGKSKSANSQQPVGAGAGTGMNLDNL